MKIIWKSHIVSQFHLVYSDYHSTYKVPALKSGRHKQIKGRQCLPRDFHVHLFSDTTQAQKRRRRKNNRIAYFAWNINSNQNWTNCNYRCSNIKPVYRCRFQWTYSISECNASLKWVCKNSKTLQATEQRKSWLWAQMSCPLRYGKVTFSDGCPYVYHEALLNEARWCIWIRENNAWLDRAKYRFHATVVRFWTEKLRICTRDETPRRWTSQSWPSRRKNGIKSFWDYTWSSRSKILTWWSCFLRRGENCWCGPYVKQ